MTESAALLADEVLHLTRYHGELAPLSRLRAAVTLAARGMGARPGPVGAGVEAQPPPRTWR